MRDNVPTSFSASFRKISTRLLTRAEKLKWTHAGITERYNGASMDIAYSTTTFRDGQFVRYAALRNSAQILTNKLTPAKTYPGTQNWTAFATFPNGTADHNYTAFASDGYSVACADRGKVYISAANDPDWAEILNLTDTVNGIIPYISITSLRYHYYAVSAVYIKDGGGINDRCDLWFFTPTWEFHKWDGYLPLPFKGVKKVNIAGVSYDGCEYIYVDNGNQRHPVLLKHYYDGNWSASHQILPTGLEDDDNSFRIGYAGLLNGFPYLTGVVSRKNGGTYSVIMSGPEDFSFGRDLIMGSNNGNAYYVREVSNVLYAVAPGLSYWADNQGPFQSPTADSANIPVDYAVTSPSIQMQTGLNAPDKLSFRLAPNQIEGTNIDVNSSVYLEATANDQPYILGRFGVDRIRREEMDSGTAYSLDCTSWALKKLIDWQSDTYFDYMGQSEAHGDPSDLTLLIRAKGKFDKAATGGAVLTEFNQDGILYTTNTASHGGWIACRFANVYDNSQDVVVGVGLNYGQETLAAAAARLGIKLTDVKEADRMTYGIFAVYVPYSISTGGGRLQLYSYNTARTDGRAHPWLLISDVAYDPSQADHWIAMSYQDGYARVYTATGTSDPYYTLRVSGPVKFKDAQPTEAMNYGRGAIFMRLDTGFQAALPFASDSDVIPFYTETEEGLTYELPMTGVCSWKFPASNGVVLVDSEQIQYTGIAGDVTIPRSTQELTVVPGKVVARTMAVPFPTPTATTVEFAKDRTCNYVVQEFTVSETCTVTALRFWVQKINYPEDGLEVRIYSGNTVRQRNEAQPMGATVSSGSFIGAGSIKAEGGYVLVHLTAPVELRAGTAYRFVLLRAKNPSHPASETYFAVKTTTNEANKGLYVFTEDDWKYHAEIGKIAEDWLYPKNGFVPFQIYAKLEGVNKEFAVALQYEAGKGLPASAVAADYHRNMAFCVTAGGGKGATLKIVRSYRFTDSRNDLYVFALEKDPGKLWDTESKARIALAFYGLKRGYNATTPAAHGNLIKIHRYAETAKNLAAAYFEYFSADEDLTVAEVARSIARKAQVPEVEIANRYQGTVVWNDNHLGGYGYWPEVPNNGTNNLIAIAYVDRKLKNNQVIDFNFRSTNLAASVVTATLGVSATGVQFLDIASMANNETVLYHDYNITLDIPIIGEIRVELFSGYVSVWIDGRLVGACQTDNTFQDSNHTWKLFTLRAVDTNAPKDPYPPIVKVLVPEAGTRVDNFVMDMGKSGTQLLTALIGEKRIFFREDRWGRLRIFTERPAVAVPVYNRAVALQSEVSDLGLATRVLLEGAEVVEVSSAGNIANYGNLFKTFNFQEINNLQDAKYFANIVLGDMQLNLKPIQFTGPADPLYEPGDKMKVYSRGAITRPLVVDSITYNLHTDQNEAAFDMQVTGRETSSF